MVRPIAEQFGKWGTPRGPMAVSAPAQQLLDEHLGKPSNPSAIQSIEGLAIRDSLLVGKRKEAIDEVVGAAAVSLTKSDRLAHALGSSLTDYLILRKNTNLPAPDAVVRPESEEQITKLIAVCQQSQIRIVPFGGGTSVVGGVDTPPGDQVTIAVAFDHFSGVLALDEISQSVTVEPGITGPELERYLGARGYTLGHFPQSFERATIGGYVATRSAGQASSGYGRSDEMVDALTVATPTGKLELGRAPMSAAGPDLRQLFIGSEGIFGIITSVTLRIRRKAEHSKYVGLMLPSFAAGQEAFRNLTQLGIRADVMRLSDENETATTLAMSGPTGRTADVMDKYLDFRNVRGGCIAILGWEAHDKSLLKARYSAAWSVLRRHGAVSLGGGVGNSWRDHRFDGPYLRDVLLDRGYLVETLETAAHWKDVARLKQGVTDALTEALGDENTDPIIMCHISHVYETGASLYFTVITLADADPISQWAAAKKAATTAITENHGTITHHHAVGHDHRAWMEAEVGPLGLSVLRAIKDHLDPDDTLNQGILLPDN